jgi:hypothetical protein
VSSRWKHADGAPLRDSQQESETRTKKRKPVAQAERPVISRQGTPLCMATNRDGVLWAEFAPYARIVQYALQVSIDIRHRATALLKPTA